MALAGVGDWRARSGAAEYSDTTGVARQFGHTNVEMVYRRYHKFVPNLRGLAGAHAARWLADQGFGPAGGYSKVTLDA